MFSIKKRFEKVARDLEIKKLEAEIDELKSQAAHFFKVRHDAEKKHFMI